MKKVTTDINETLKKNIIYSPFFTAVQLSALLSVSENA